jgi:hypothetical protein
VVDGVLQIAVVGATPHSDGLPGSISHNITTTCSEGWPHVPTDDVEPVEDHHDGPVLHPLWARDTLDLELRVVVIPMCPAKLKACQWELEPHS